MAELDRPGRLVTAARVAQRALAEGRRLESRLPAAPAGFAVTCVLEIVCLAALVGSAVLLHPQRAIVGSNPASDFQIMTWSLDWWPWAIGHGADPLHTHLLWAPGGFSTLWITAMPAIGLLALPLTLMLGPLFAYNALMFAAVALAGGCAYLLCREITDRTAPSVVGGLMFGLSPYMLGHALSQHLNLTFVWPIPLVAWAVVRRLRGRWRSGRSFVLVVAVLLLVELGASLEIFLDLTLVLGIAFVLALAGGSMRRETLRVAALVGLAYAVCLPIMGAVAYLALTTPHGALSYPPADFSTDLFNVVVPTPVSLFGAGHAVRALSRHFVGNIGEQDGYLGLPVIALVALAARARWRQGAWVAACLFVVLLALSLGPALTIRGRPYASLPFSTARLPLLADILPARLSLFTMLLAACLCSVWLSLGGRVWLRVGAGAVVLLSLLPNFALSSRTPGAWAYSNVTRFSTARPPRGFVDASGWSGLVRPGENVLVLPTGARTAAMYWQLESHMRFRLAVPGTPFVPPRLDAQPTVVGLVDDTLPYEGASLAAARLRSFLTTAGVGAVVVAPAAGGRWRRIVAAATHAAPHALGKSLVYRVSSGLPPLRASGKVATAGAGATALVARVRYDGVRGQLELALGSSSAVQVSTPSGDVDETATAVGADGRAAVVFTEWRRGSLLVEVATHDPGGPWRVVTVDRRKQPVWSPRIVIAPNGTTAVTWVDQTDPLRLVRAAIRTPSGRWQPTVTLDEADGLAAVEMAAAAHGGVLFAWHDSLANEERVRVASYSRRGWRSATTVGSAVGGLTRVRITGSPAKGVEWQAHGRIEVWHREETT